MKQYARIFQYLGAYKGKIILYFLFTLFSIIFSIVSIGMLMPFLQLIFLEGKTGVTSSSNNAVIQSINDFLNNAVETRGKIATLGIICLLMVSFIIFKNLFLYLSYYILNPLKNRIVNQLREDLYDKVLRLPIGFFNEKRKGDLMSRMTNDVGEVEGSVVGTLEGWIRDPLTIIVTLTVLFFISAQPVSYTHLTLPTNREV